MRNRTPKDDAEAPAALAERALGGDRAAFEALITHYQSGLRRLLLRRAGGDGVLVDELLHQTWIGLWQAFCERRYDPRRAAISTFIYAIAHKRWLQHLRRTGNQPLSGADIDFTLLADSSDESETDPARALHSAEMLAAFRDCLHAPNRSNSLSPEERQIVVELARGQTERSLAAVLGLAPSTIHMRKQLAYKKLRDCMTAKGYQSNPLE